MGTLGRVPKPSVRGSDGGAVCAPI
jgi:hypothetical protein